MVKILSPEQLIDLIGKDLGTSEWMTVDQDRINQFAEATNDHQFIHVDPEQAKAVTPYGGTIAHGFLTLSLLSYLAAGIGVYPEGMVMGINYGLNKVRFLTPVKVDSEIRARGKQLDIASKGHGRYLSTMEITVEIKGETKPALIAEWLGLYITR
ncbi:MAG: MaoC family dehydratase [Sphingomonadales bacterium]|nr:MaoC family dehydratase [Sphingomonadales bacterium]